MAKPLFNQGAKPRAIVDCDGHMLNVNPDGSLNVGIGGCIECEGCILSADDEAVGAFDIESLDCVQPAYTATVQNTGPAGSYVRVREELGGLGAGLILPRFAMFTYECSCQFCLEVEEIAGVPTSVAIQWEIPDGIFCSPVNVL
jgi:hypothetical protein